MPTHTTLPNVWGYLSTEDICVQAEENSLIEAGASIGGCSSESSPDSTSGSEAEGDEETFSVETGPLDDSEPECIGGGSKTIKKNDTFTGTFIVKKGNRTEQQMKDRARDMLLQASRLKIENDIGGPGGTNPCYEGSCEGNCEAVSSWNAAVVGKVTINSIKKYNVGTSTETWVINLKIEITIQNSINVACNCDESE